MVIQTAFLGDLLLGAIFFRRLRLEFPNHRIELVARPRVGEILLRLMFVDQVHEVVKGNASSYRRFLASRKGVPYDFLFLIHQSLRSALLARGISAKHKVAYRKWWNGILGFQHSLDRRMDWPEPLRQLQLLAAVAPATKTILAELGSQNWQEKLASGELVSPPENLVIDVSSIVKALEPEIAVGVKSQSSKIAIFPGSVWGTKRWTAEGFAQLISALVQRKYEVWLMGAPDERELCEKIFSQLTDATGVRNFCGQLSLWHSLRLLTEVGVVVSNDSASAHMASLVGRPVVSIFGPTVLSFGYRPWAKRVAVIENEGLACRPCGKHGPQVCPLGHHKCMKEISAETVLREVQRFIPR